MRDELYQKEKAKEFYEARYEHGYMDEWPTAKKKRVFELIRALPLPPRGKALDFGCGNGVFTEVLHQALPEWEVYGCDISTVSIENAKSRFPQCRFFISDNESIPPTKFDFLFSHHVLEHVFDIQKTMEEIDAYLKEEAGMLHIFPCGNEGSLEQRICAMRVDGMNEAMENRFFYEDEGHIRRLTTDRTNALAGVHGFSLAVDFYSNQYWGALKWITQLSPMYAAAFADPSKAVDGKARKSLRALRSKFILLNILQFPSVLFNYMKTRKKRGVLHSAGMVITFLPHLLSCPVYSYINRKADQEWAVHRKERSGSEMYLFYKRVSRNK